MAGRCGLVVDRLPHELKTLRSRARNTATVKWFFLLAFFFFFLLLFPFLHHGTISVGRVSRVVPRKRCISVVGSIPGRGIKCYRDQLVTARGDLYGKLLAASSVGRKMDKSAVFGAQTKKKNLRSFKNWPP